MTEAISEIGFGSSQLMHRSKGTRLEQLVPNQMRYQAALRPDFGYFYRIYECFKQLKDDDFYYFLYYSITLH